MTSGCKNPYPPIFDLCWCGCNKTVWGGKRFIDGHESIGRKSSYKTCQIQSEKRTKRNIQPFQEHFHSDETKRKQLIASTKICLYDEQGNKEIYPKIPTICYCMKSDCYEILWGGQNWVQGHHTKGKKVWNKGIPQSEDSKEKNRISHMREKNINFGKSRSESSKLKQSISMNGKNAGINHYLFEKHLPEITKQKISENHADMSGENNPCYIDGRSFEPYCPRFNFRFKESVRLRDSHTCQLCGKTQIEEGKRLAVHHVHYDKKNCYPDVVCLCTSCNARVNKITKRKNFEYIFMNILNDKKFLFWSRRKV